MICNHHPMTGREYSIKRFSFSPLLLTGPSNDRHRVTACRCPHLAIPPPASQCQSFQLDPTWHLPLVHCQDLPPHTHFPVCLWTSASCAEGSGSSSLLQGWVICLHQPPSQQSPFISIASRSGLALFYGIRSNGRKGSKITKHPQTWRVAGETVRKAPLLKWKKTKVVSEKLPRSVLENMKGRKVSDLFGFIKWLDGLGRVLIFYNKKEKKMLSALCLRAIFFCELSKYFAENHSVSRIKKSFSKTKN